VLAGAELNPPPDASGVDWCGLIRICGES
jgi:hypothetical protein